MSDINLLPNYIELGAAICRQAAKDWHAVSTALQNDSISDTHRIRLERQLHELEKFFRSEFFNTLTGVSPEEFKRLVLKTIADKGKLPNAASANRDDGQRATPADIERIKKQNARLKRRKGKPTKEQPCWTCANAEDGRLCCWANGIPRDDWKAEKVEFISGGRLYCSYAIKKCPAYRKEERK